jgi:tRNA(Ile)-lysidine synthase
MDDFLSFFSDRVEEIFQEQIADIKVERVAVAVSGGSDSVALTLLLNEFCRVNKIELFAVTVDHKMRIGSAKEAQELSEFLATKEISHQILSVPEGRVPQKNIEANLREIRYELLYEFCQENEIKLLFLGHILGDIAENFLIRLFRGSGLDGLSAISEVHDYKDIKLVRPLLDCSKDDLQQYLKLQNVKWFEDETNEDERFVRNKIRNFFNSFEEKNLIQKRVKNAADEVSKMRDFFDDILLKEAEKILQIECYEQGSGEFYFLIDHDRFRKLDEKIALKILALVLMEVGDKPYKPRLEKLKNFYQYLQDDQIKPRNFYGCMAKKFDEKSVIISAEKESSNRNLRTILKRVF